MSNVENLEDHMAFSCECGCVRFNLLKSGGIECDDCGEKIDSTWGLAQPEQERCENCGEFGVFCQPKQEYGVVSGIGKGLEIPACVKYYYIKPILPLHPRQEPVGEAYLCDRCHTPFDGAYECQSCGHNEATKEPVYTTPPQRTWVNATTWRGLTDEQIKRDFEKWAKENYVQGFELYGDSYHNGHTRNRWQGWLAAHRAIEAKLKEKNT